MESYSLYVNIYKSSKFQGHSKLWLTYILFKNKLDIAQTTSTKLNSLI